MDRVGDGTDLPEVSPYQETTPGGVEDAVRGQQADLGSVGPYRLLALLGEGGMGQVFYAVHRKLDIERAVKVLVAGRDASKRDIQRFEREARACMRLSHPGIVTVHELGEDDGRFYLAMDLIDGRTLDAVVEDEGGSLPPRQALRWTAQIARALNHAHEQGVIHRDVKPQNILIGNDGRARLLDFGLALDMASDETRLTMSQGMLGTPAFMAPEQAQGGSDKIGPWTDVYGLGATLMFALSGRPPFDTEVLLRLLSQISRADTPRLRDRLPAVHLDVDTICATALQRVRRRRFRSADAMAEDIERFLRGDRISVRPVSRLQLEWDALRQNRTTSWLTNGMLVLFGLFYSLFFAHYLEMRDHLERLSQLKSCHPTERRAAISELVGMSRHRELLAGVWGHRELLPVVERARLDDVSEVRVAALEAVMKHLEASTHHCSDLIPALLLVADRAAAPPGEVELAWQCLELALGDVDVSAPRDVATWRLALKEPGSRSR